MKKNIIQVLKLTVYVCLLSCFYMYASNVQEGESFWLLGKKTTESVFDYLITQQNINNGLVISIPGSYGLAENIEFSLGTAITIATDGVDLNLNNHTIECLSTSTGIAVTISGSHALNFISVTNGSIKGGIIGVNAQQVASGLIESLQIANVTTQGIVVTDCMEVFINNCQINGDSTAVGINAQFTLTGTAQITIQDSAVSGCSVGFMTGNNTNNSSLAVKIQNCTAANCATGFSISNLTQLLECIAQAAVANGFIISSFGASLKDCLAINGGADGFQINSSQVILQNCTSILNTLNGFNIPLTAPVAANITFEECVAFDNEENGFTLNTNNSLVQSCIAYANSSGFVFNGGTGNAFTNNIAFFNQIANFSNAPANSLVATSLAAVKVMNATYWWNVTPQ